MFELIEKAFQDAGHVALAALVAWAAGYLYRRWRDDQKERKAELAEAAKSREDEDARVARIVSQVLGSESTKRIVKEWAIEVYNALAAREAESRARVEERINDLKERIQELKERDKERARSVKDAHGRIDLVLAATVPSQTPLPVRPEDEESRS